ncbi:MAG: NAD-dependent epimerase/dehydratase family protein [Gemmatimonadaceae bacterium]
MLTRRDFLKTGAVAGGAVIAGGAAAVSRASEAAAHGITGASGAPMNILILGGTGFIGPHLVRQMVARGHKVTIFTRGRRDGNLPPGIERLVGDRMINDTIPQGNLRALDGRRWDAVFDDSATDPRWVRQSTALLKDSGLYLFVSSTGVFLPYKTPNNAETARVIVDPPNSTDYGVRKARSEQVVLQAFGNRGIVVRPGYIVGPGDNTDRFSYWPQRFARGGEILVPGKQTDPSQFVDVRDLTEFMVKIVEERRNGTYNATGPRERLQWGQFIAETHAALKPDATLVWVDDYDFLKEHRMTYAIPWMIPEGDQEHHLQINNRKAVAAGLKFRPIADTVRDTLADWPNRLAALPQGRQPDFRWTTPEREVEVLGLWKRRKNG